VRATNNTVTLSSIYHFFYFVDFISSRRLVIFTWACL